MFKVIPAGKGMSMLQSDPMPTAEAEKKLATLNEEMGEDTETEGREEAAGMPDKMPAMPMMAGKGAPMGGRGPVPPFGARPGGAPGMMGGRGPVPPFAG